MTLFLGIGAVVASADEAEETAVVQTVEEPAALEESAAPAVEAPAAAAQADEDYLNNPFDKNPYWHWDDKTYYQDTLARFMTGYFGKFLRWIVVHLLFGWLWFPWVGWSTY
jgi:hypothetical protein